MVVNVLANQILSPDYITPDNDIWLLRLIPLEPNYENTILWIQGVDINGEKDPSETIEQARARQFGWFTSRPDALHISSTTYQRENRKYIRVDKPIKDLIGYNYLVFKNTGSVTKNGVTVNKYENKYYYAFITNYEYLNDRVTLIHYSIDLLQTFNFDYEVAQCFVEREHSETDNVGDNLLEEPVSPGQVNYYFQGSTTELSEWYIGLLCSESYSLNPISGQYEWNPMEGKKVGNLYNGLYFAASDDEAIINEFLMQATKDAKSDSIVSVFMVPKNVALYYYITNYYTNTWYIPKDIYWTYSYTKTSGLTPSTGPRNRKLYTYPFNKLYISNNSGEAYEYHYEYFKDTSNSVAFGTYGTVLANGEFLIAPYNYRLNDNLSINNLPNFNESMSIKNFPQCSYTIDAYRAWLAQTKGSRIANYASAGVEFAGGMIGGFLTASTPVAPTRIPSQVVSGVNSMIGTSTNFFREMATMIGKEYDMSRVPATVHGQATESLNLALNTLNFYAYNVHVNPQYACMIDDFFDLYGYSSKKLKKPNRDVRENWCYCKTIGCRLSGAIPGDVDDAICTIYNNGVRFWKNPNNIGRYQSLTNRPMSEISPNTPNNLNVIINNSKNICKLGESIDIKCSVYYGRTPYSYTWKKQINGSTQWEVIPNETSDTLSITPTMIDNQTKYKVTVVDSVLTSVTSNETELIVIAEPDSFYTIISPISIDVTAGETITITSTVVGGEAPYTYQWKYLTPNASSWVSVSNGGTSASYSLTTASRHNGYEYKLVVTDANSNTVESNISVLTVS